MIPPALTSKEWRAFSASSAHSPMAAFGFAMGDIAPENHAGRIAVHNALLPESDPRKITWAMVDRLRTPHRDSCSMWWISDYPGAQMCDCGGDEEMLSIADALASYLPPRS